MADKYGSALFLETFYDLRAVNYRDHGDSAWVLVIGIYQNSLSNEILNHSK